MADANSKNRLAKNTAYLYILTLSSQVISLLTVPYQTRVLSPETYGTVGFAISVMTIVSLVVNFGFIYSATQDVAENTQDKRYVSKVYSAVFAAKLLIAFALLLVVAAAVAGISYLREYASLMLGYYFAFVASVLLPDFLYRGYEQMRVITIRTVAIRLSTAVLIFAFLKDEGDVMVLPLSMLLGNAAALFVCLGYDKKRLGVSFVRFDASFLWSTIRKSFPFFVSRAASTVYQSANAVILGAFYPGQAVVGWFNAADKVLTVFKYASSPVADSLYPYMIKNKDYRLALRLIAVSIPVIIVVCGALFICAEDFCSLLFGEAYRDAGNVLRCLIPAMAVIFPTYVICFPILVPMGLSRFANRSNVIGMTVQLCLLVVLLATGNLDVYTLCLSASASEVAVFAYRLAVMISFRSSMRQGGDASNG